MTYIREFCAACGLLEDAGGLTERTNFCTFGCWKGRMILRLHDLLGHDRDNRRLMGSLIFEAKCFKHAV